MQKKVCPNGHIYDPSIYGDQCPMCPAPGAPQPSPAQPTGLPFNPTPATASPGLETHVSPPRPVQNRPDVNGPTLVRPDARPTTNPAGGGAHTVIRRPGLQAGQQQAVPGRKLVGFLVTYRDPLGKAYNLYEGRNYIGRDHSCDICINDDDQLSGRHMSILYRSVDNKFKFRDEQSSNGTFINKQLIDDGELQNYDIIRVGSTIFIFIAIPRIG